MKTYFLDTSALVKRYHQEKGSHVIDRIFAEPGVTIIISDISIIEFYSAIALKVRTGAIQEVDFATLRKRFAQDIKDGVCQIAELTKQGKAEAANLLITYGKTYSLKTLDAIQLAIIKLRDPHKTFIVVCADEKFCKIIELEGFHTCNPML